MGGGGVLEKGGLLQTLTSKRGGLLERGVNREGGLPNPIFFFG